jgi:glutathione S-transferase
MFAPFLERMAASVPYYKGLLVRGNPKWPHVNKWFEAMEERESFQGIMSDYYTHVHDLPPQIGQCYSVQEAAKYAGKALDPEFHTLLSLPCQ